MLFMFKPLAVILLAFSLFTVQCSGGGPLSRLDSTLDFAPLFFQGLVISGTISQSDADKYKSGLTHFEAAADETKKCLSDNIVPDVQCYVDLGNKTRSVVAQFYPNANSGKAGEWVSLIQEVVSLIIKKNTPSVGVGGPVDPDVVDRELDSKIDQLDRLQKSVPR